MARVGGAFAWAEPRAIGTLRDAARERPVSVVSRTSSAQERREEQEGRKQQRPPGRMAVDHTPRGRRHRLRASTTLAGLPARPAHRRTWFTRLRLIDI